MLYVLRTYFSSWWMPTALTMLVLCLLLLQQIILRVYWLTETLAILLLLSFLSIFSASIFQFVSRSWKKGMLSLILCLVLGAISFFAGAVVLFFCTSPFFSQDNFGKNIVIPPDMVVEEPQPNKIQDPWAVAEVSESEGTNDPEGREFTNIYSDEKAQSAGPTVQTDLKILNNFVEANRDLLLRHLASSVKWFVTEEHGKVYAYRRFVTEGGRWANSLHGYYSKNDFDMWGEGDFQFRIVLGIDGPVLDQPWQGDSTKATVGSGALRLNVKKDDNSGLFESYLVLESNGPALEIFEEAETKSRPFTALALSKVEKELTALRNSKAARKHGFDAALLPAESLKKGNPEIWLVGDYGIYLVYAYVNPGEKGHAYLKIFEATQNTPLSTSRLSERSTEHLGWSDDPTELFFYNTEITVYEGSPGVYYPARFELWFVPASGAPERKLIEKIFKIEGWDR